MSNISQSLEREVVRVAKDVEEASKAWLYNTHKLMVEPFTTKNYPYVSFEIYINGHHEGYVPVKKEEFADGLAVRKKVLNGAIDLILDYLYH